MGRRNSPHAIHFCLTGNSVEIQQLSFRIVLGNIFIADIQFIIGKIISAKRNVQHSLPFYVACVASAVQRVHIVGLSIFLANAFSVGFPQKFDFQKTHSFLVNSVATVWDYYSNILRFRKIQVFSGFRGRKDGLHHAVRPFGNINCKSCRKALQG